LQSFKFSNQTIRILKIIDVVIPFCLLINDVERFSVHMSDNYND